MTYLPVKPSSPTTAATSLNDTDTISIMQSGVSVIATLAAVKTYIGSSSSTSPYLVLRDGSFVALRDGSLVTLR